MNLNAFFSELLLLCLLLLILLTAIVVFMGIARLFTLTAFSTTSPILTEDQPLQPQQHSNEGLKDNPITQAYVKRHFFNDQNDLKTNR
ncbi:hypothetical protein [Paenibacillus sp. DMB5]|uniref:hypothetical protein n=1 Tax=Paenibacillus sp. DMB5 TaxID=1780103 RepID=UPI00076C6FFA|nr:hypothetical protein [Paenibacillus sp. DMB5]KUP24715.1 hypothetical protein AWJ19_17865 [Paenibacillus sp. DMB5]